MTAPKAEHVSEVGRENLALRRLVAVYRHLSSLAVQGVGIEAVTELIAERVDITVAVVDEKLTVLAAAMPGGSPERAARYVGDVLVHPRLAQVLGIARRSRRALRLPEVDDTEPVIVAPILVGDEVLAYLMTLDEGEPDEDLRLLLTEHAATICGVILGRERVVAAAATQVRYDLVEGLLSGKGSDPSEVERWARHLGYDGDLDHRVVSIVLESHGDGDLARRVSAAVERFFTTRAPEAITAVRGHEVAVILPEPDDASSQAEPLATTCLERVREVFRDTVVTAGIGGTCRAPSGIARSYDDARRAVDITRRMGRAGTAVTFDNLGIHRLLLQVADMAQLREFAKEVFGDAQDGSNMAEYLSTLSCYFRANNSLQRAAQTLHVHPNTVTYRIRRIEEVTGLDFGNYRDRLMTQVALEILDAVGWGEE